MKSPAFALIILALASCKQPMAAATAEPPPIHVVAESADARTVEDAAAVAVVEDAAAETEPEDAAIVPAVAASDASAAQDDDRPVNPARELAFADPTADVPEALRPRVAELRRTIARATRCWEQVGRVSARLGPHCNEWIAELRGGGDAAAYAIGAYMVAEAYETHTAEDRRLSTMRVRADVGGTRTGRGSMMAASERLAPMVASLENAVLVPSILRLLARPIFDGYMDWGTDEEILRYLQAIEPLTGNALAPWPPWQFISQSSDTRSEYLRNTFNNWVHWYGLNKSKPRSQWLAEGRARYRRDLDQSNVQRRFAAIVRFTADDATAEERAAATTSVRTLLAERRISAAGRAYVTRYAREHHMLDEAADAGTVAR